MRIKKHTFFFNLNKNHFYYYYYFLPREIQIRVVFLLSIDDFKCFLKCFFFSKTNQLLFTVLIYKNMDVSKVRLHLIPKMFMNLSCFLILSGVVKQVCHGSLNLNIF